MPIPTPGAGESRDDFIGRCMGDPKMNEEYPEQAQRYAVCAGQLPKERAMPSTVRKRYFGKAASVDRDNMVMTVVMTNKRKDRDGDVVEPKGATLTDWLQNPVVLWAHDKTGVPIAKVTDTLVSDEMVMGVVQFDRKDPFSVLVFNKYADGFLNAWSIGFRANQKGMDPITDEQGIVTGFHFKEWELLELSAVPVPANPNALVREIDGMEKGLRDRFVAGGLALARDCRCGELEKLYKDISDAGKEPGEPEDITKPFPSEHAARLENPDKYARFRRENNKFGDGIHAIWGVLQNGTVELQAIRFDKTKFTPAEAKRWLEAHDFTPIQFEDAAGEERGLALEWNGFVGPRVVQVGKDGAAEPCDKWLRPSAMKKSAEERGAAGKIPVLVSLGEAPAARVDFTVVQERDGEIVEAKISSVSVTLPLPSREKAPTEGSGRPSEGADGKASDPAAQAVESSTTLEELELEVMRLKARASTL